MKYKHLIQGALGIIFVAGLLVGCGKKEKITTSESQLIVGTEGTYAPYSFHDETGRLVGYDVEIAEAVSEKLGLEVEFVEAKWNGIVAGLDAKKWDVVFNQVSITTEREAKYNFSTPYTYTRGALVVKKDNNDITSFTDLKGKKSAQSITSNWAKVVEEYGGEVVGADGFSQSVQLVIDGRVEATVNDDVTYYDFIKSKHDANVKIAALSDETTKTVALLRKEDTTLTKEINAALEELKDEGKLSEISNKYFGVDVSVE